MILTGDYAKIDIMTNLFGLDAGSWFQLTEPTSVAGICVCTGASRYSSKPKPYPAGTIGYLLGEVTDLYPGLADLHLRPTYAVVLLTDNDAPQHFLVPERQFHFAAYTVPSRTIAASLLQSMTEAAYRTVLTRAPKNVKSKKQEYHHEVSRTRC